MMIHYMSEGPFQFVRRKQSTYQAVTGYHGTILDGVTRYIASWRGKCWIQIRWGGGRRQGKKPKDKPCKLNYEIGRMRHHPDNKNGAEVRERSTVGKV